MRFYVHTGLVAFLLVSAGITRATIVVDFEDWTGSTETQYVVPSGGFEFHGLLSVGPDPGGNNPTNVLHSLTYTFKFTTQQQRPFSIISLDLQEGPGIPGAASVMLVGSREQTQVIQTFDLDGDPATYETHYPNGFSDLVGVHVYAYDAQGFFTPGPSIDNLVVPEPATLTLLAIALFGLLLSRP